MIDDHKLIERILYCDDQYAFTVLLKKYQSPIRQFLRRLTAGQRDIADDIAQETFIKVYRKLDTFKGQASLTTWIHKIAYYCYLRSQQKQYLQEEMQGFDLSEFETKTDNKDKDILIEQLMKMLSHDERTCLTLSISVGFTHDEICEVTQLPLGTVKSHINRGKSKLVKAVDKTA